jgi:transcription antitermination factor NusG
MENKINIKSQTMRNWFVIYTRARWEKKVDQLLKQQGINSFCPLRKVKNKWADRMKVVEFPLFSSYVFVYINLKEEQVVRQTHGVLNFIYYMGKPAIIRSNEIEMIKQILVKTPDVEIMSLKDINVGDKVTIKNGLLCNQEGRIIKVTGKTVLMVFDNLECALVSRVAVENLTLIPS